MYIYIIFYYIIAPAWATEFILKLSLVVTLQNIEQGSARGGGGLGGVTPLQGGLGGLPTRPHASVGLFTVYFLFLQKYLYNKYSLLKYIC